MAKRLHLSIPSACHEGWEKMTPSEKGRFCSSCQKQVVDFSKMSDRQVAEFFNKPIRGLRQGDSVCGHFITSQLNRTIEIPKKPIPYAKYFFQVAIPAFLVSLKASGQKIHRGENTNHTKNVTAIVSSTALDDVVTYSGCKFLKQDTSIDKQIQILKGVVMDEEKNAPLLGATVMKKGTSTGVVTDAEGKFSLADGPKESDLILQISSVGYETQEIVVNKSKPDLISVQLRIARSDFMDGLMIITRLPLRKELTDIPLMKSIAKDNISFWTYPNPVSAGSSVSIGGTKLKDGNYSVTLFGQSGESVFKQELIVNDKKGATPILVPNVAAGSYFLVLVNKKTGKKFTQGIIVQ